MSFLKLRRDLDFTPVRDSTGKETIVVTDPVANRYYRLSRYQVAFLEALDGTVTIDQARERMKLQGRYYTEQEVQGIVGRAAQVGLLLGAKVGTSEYLIAQKKLMDKARRIRDLSSLLYLYIPLLNPDLFLTRTVWLFRLLYNKYTATVLCLLIPGALYCAADGVPRILNNFSYFFNFNNLIYLWLTIAFAKIIHEFGHAYVAKSFGLRVPVMGLGFIIFCPVLYCDTTDAWTLADRKHRIAISAAGILAEATLATICAYIWYLSRPGLVNSVALYLMTYSLVSTLMFNGNPLMKFDGYYCLADMIEMPNLSVRAQTFVKFLWMNKVLGLKKWQNPASTSKDASILLLYGVCAFAYRIFIVMAIVAGAYYKLDKSLGIFLALFAFCIIILYPLSRGSRTLVTNIGSIRPGLAGSLVFLSLLAIAAPLTFLPWSSKSVYPCYMASARSQKLTVPLLATIKEVLIEDGSEVRAGELLSRLDPARLQLSLIEKEIDLKVLKNEVELLLLDDRERSKAGGKEVELHQKEDEIRKVAKDVEIARNGVTAAFDGVVVKLEPKFQPGFQPGEGAVVGVLCSRKDGVVHALIPEHAVERVKKGQAATVWFPIGTGWGFSAAIDEVKPYGERDLAETPFSSHSGGELATEEVDVKRNETNATGRKKESPLEAQYMVSVYFDNSEAKVPLGLGGRLVVYSPPRSLWSRCRIGIFQTFNRESMF